MDLNSVFAKVRMIPQFLFAQLVTGLDSTPKTPFISFFNCTKSISCILCAVVGMHERDIQEGN